MLSRLNAGNGDAALATVVAARAADVAYGIAGVGRTATAAVVAEHGWKSALHVQRAGVSK